MPENFLTYWIRKGMKTQKEEEELTRQHLKSCVEGAAELRKRWDEPLQGPGYWNTVRHTVQTKARQAEAKAQPISHYEAAIADVKAGREDAQNAGK